MIDAKQRLSAMGLKLPEAPKPVASYVPFIISGDQLFISGQISTDDAGRVLTGVLGAGMSIEDGQTAARHAALNILAQTKTALGSLERIAQVLRLTGYVASSAGFRPPKSSTVLPISWSPFLPMRAATHARRSASRAFRSAHVSRSMPF